MRAVATLCGRRLRPPASPRDLLARHLSGAVVAQVGLLRTAPRIGEVDAHHRPAIFGDFSRTAVAHEDRLSRHDSPPSLGLVATFETRETEVEMQEKSGARFLELIT
jgi:hypothetical protein